MSHISNILTWNIANDNSLCGKKQDDEDFIDIINKHSVVCLQETGSEINLVGYESYSKLRRHGRKGGVTTLVSNSLNNVCQQIDLQLDDLNPDLSMNIVVLKFMNHVADNSNISVPQDTFLFNVYIPPANSRRRPGSSDSSEKYSK